MKCPKCGYNSFDHLDSCKKCGKNLVSFKQQYGIKSVLFPGQMKPTFSAAETELEGATVEEAVAVAVTTAERAAAGSAVAEDFEAPPTGEGDDFGFDFMGESEAEEDLSFDELFEEAPADEDVEETLPEPEQQAQKAKAEDDFAFDIDTEESEGDALPADDELADDFGFNVDEDEDNKSSADVGAADFDLPPAEEDFVFNDDEGAAKDADKQAAGTKEDPKDPFEVPGSPQQEEIPEQTVYYFEQPATAPAGEEQTDLSSAAPASSADEVSDREESGSGPVAEPPAASEPAEAEVFVASPDLAAAAVSTGGDAVAPATGTTTDEAGLLPPVAGRIGAFACDLLLLLLVGTSFIVAAEAVMSSGGKGLFPSTATLLDLSIPYFLVLFSLAFGYFTLFHFLTGQTPGKMLAGLRVETLAGEPLAFSQAFLRSVGGLLQLLPLGLGYLVILASADRRGWNDQLAGTRLVNLRQLTLPT